MAAESTKTPSTGKFTFIPDFLSSGEAEVLFETCRTGLSWREVKWGSTGRKLPRLVAQVEDISDFTGLAREARKVIPLIVTMGYAVTGLWCNHYRDGSDHTPEHRDSDRRELERSDCDRRELERSDTYGCTVGCLSLGGPRVLNTRPEEKGVKGKITKRVLPSGSFYLFDQEFNRTHLHAIPKSTAMTNPRISLVFFLLEWKVPVPPSDSRRELHADTLTTAKALD